MINFFRKRPKKKLVVHIGHPKTGTSTIQKTLVENEHAINKMGLVYPAFGRKFNAHHLIVGALVSHKNDNFLPRSEITGDDVIKNLNVISKNNEIEVIIISSEAFVSATGFKPTFDQLSELFDLHIVWVLRAPTEHATSMVNQRIRMGFFQQGVLLDSIIKDAVNLPNYAEKARLWTSKFPNARFSVASMGKDFDAWDFFCAQVDKRIRNLVRPLENSNVSLAPEALAFLLRMQSQNRVRSNAESSRIITMLEQYTKTADFYPRNVTFIPPDVQKALLHKFSNAGAELARIFPGFDPQNLEPRERVYVDLAAIPPEHVMKVYDFCMERYDQHVTFLKR